MGVGSVIVSKRRSLGLSQEQFAERVGVARQTVSSWENDIFVPDTPNVMQMARLFGCTTDEILNPPRTSESTTNKTPVVEASFE